MSLLSSLWSAAVCALKLFHDAMIFANCLSYYVIMNIYLNCDLQFFRWLSGYFSDLDFGGTLVASEWLCNQMCVSLKDRCWSWSKKLHIYRHITVCFITIFSSDNMKQRDFLFSVKERVSRCRPAGNMNIYYSQVCCCAALYPTKLIIVEWPFRICATALQYMNASWKCWLFWACQTAFAARKKRITHMQSGG